MVQTRMVKKFVVLGASSLLLLGALSGCSVSVASDSCHGNAAVACGAPASGYSCTGAATPDPSLDCSDGVLYGDETDYCCFSATTVVVAGCSVDNSTTGCVGEGADYGFRCSGGAVPSSDLVCGAGVADANGDLLYCCNVPSCNASSNVVCVGGATGVACSGSAVPDASQNCSAGEIGPSGNTYYCCGGTAGSCQQNGNVMCNGATGYSCTGTADPTATGMVCSEGVVAAGAVNYCCVPFASSTCVQDNSVACPSPGSYGFACSGTDAPSDTDTALTCSAGTAGNDGNTLYCCQ